MKNPFMQAALEEARAALEAGEVPVGAVLVKDGRILARGHNRREALQSPLSHAEIAVIGAASRALGSWRLSGCDLYVTLEPCAMCCGAIAQARIRRVYFGAYDPRGGFAVSNAALLSHPGLFHRPECYCGIMEEECSGLLRLFFQETRRPESANAKNQTQP